MDKHRFVACISASGHSTIDAALPNTTVVHRVATDRWWIEDTNHVSNLKFIQNLREQTFDWLWIKASSINPGQHPSLERIVEWSTRHDVEAVFMTWNSTDATRRAQRNGWITSLSKMVKASNKYSVQRFEVNNTNCGGNMERCTTVLVIHSTRLKEPMAGINRHEWSSPVEDALDPGNHIYSDYLVVPIDRHNVTTSAVLNQLTKLLQNAANWSR
jgi:hypothetical protein